MRKVILSFFFLSLLVFSSCDVTDTNGINFLDYGKTNDSYIVAPNNSANDTEFQYVNTTVNTEQQNEFVIGAWNVQIFGRAKAANVPVYNAIVDVIQDYDIIAIQEIRDNTNTVIDKLKSIDGYDIIYSDPLGRTKSKEAYAILYRPSLVKVDRYLVYNDVDDVFERPPFISGMTVDNYSFTMVVIHTKPSDAQREIVELRKVINYARETFENKNVVVMGDLNAAKPYYTGGELGEYTWLITDDMDTTVGNSNKAYDRIIILNQHDNWKDCGVDWFEDDINGDRDLLNAMSDHAGIFCKVEI